MNSSYLMVAGDKTSHLDKLDTLRCTKAIVNLEDGVYDKQYARDLVYNTLSNRDNSDIIIRVNNLDSCGLDDIKVINKIKPFAIRVPKIQSIEDIKKCLKLINDNIQVHLSIETARALKDLKNFKIDKRVTTVYLGILDMLGSLKLPQSILELSNPTVDYILSKFLVDSKIANLDPVSFVYQDYKNTNKFKQWCYKVKSMGFESKVGISFGQIDIINDIFKIDNKDIKKAKYIVEIYEKNLTNKLSGFKDDRYGFIDEPIYKDAKLLLSKI